MLLLVSGTEVRLLGEAGSPLRRLHLDPTIDYQRDAPSRRRRKCLRCPDTSVSDVSGHHMVGLAGFEPATS